jgi:hypothetical protein
MNKLIYLLPIIILAGCSSTRTEFVELPAKVVREKVYINCNVPADLLEKNKININSEDNIKEALEKIAKEYNERGFKLDSIGNIKCIKKGL